MEMIKIKNIAPMDYEIIVFSLGELKDNYRNDYSSIKGSTMVLYEMLLSITKRNKPLEYPKPSCTFRCSKGEAYLLCSLAENLNSMPRELERLLYELHKYIV